MSHRFTPIDLSLECRRLFLRRWKPVGIAGLENTHVNVDIWVRYENAAAEKDELEDVLDYNVMRDALMRAGVPDSWTFVDNALEELMRSPIQAAHVELVCDGPDGRWLGSRHVCR